MSDLRENEVVEEKQVEQVEDKKATGSSFYKQKLEQIIQENNDLKTKLEETNTNSLKEKENFKELWEREKQKRLETEDKNKKLASSYVNYFKTTAIKEAALKSGILDQALDDIHLVDNSMVQIETTDKGNVNVHGANEFVEHLKEVKPHWFKKIGLPNINNSNSSLPEKPKALSAKDILELEKKEPQKYKEEMLKRLGKI